MNAAPSPATAPPAVASAVLREHELRACDGVRLKWFEAGTGFPVVVSLPIGLHRDFLLPLIDACADDHRLIFLQSRGLWGSGSSTDPRNDTLDFHARDTAAMIGAAGLIDYAVLGYCGGSAPLVQALEYVERSPKQAMLVSTLFRRAGFENLVDRLIARLQTSNQPDSYRMILEIAFRYGAPGFKDHAEREICKPEKFLSYLNQLRSLYQYSFPRRLRVDGPLTIVTAENDIDAIRTSTDEFMDELESPLARRWEVPGAGHFFLYENPGLARALFMRWLGTSLRQEAS